MASFRSQGRGRAMRGFRIPLQTANSSSSARASTSPVRRVFGISSRTRARAIQISPWSLREERKGSTASRKAQRQLSWMPFRMPNSNACMVFSPLSGRFAHFFL